MLALRHERAVHRPARVRALVVCLALVPLAAIMLPAVSFGVSSTSPPAVNPDAAPPASLPAVSSGARPGPSVLYEPPPSVPELSVKPPFKAEPLLVSGADAYRAGEYLYQDHLFDDRGAARATSLPAPVVGGALSPGVKYPTAKRFARNAADLVEFRVRPTRHALVYRVTLNTVLAPDVAAVGIGIDRDAGGGEPVTWPNRAGISTPGLDAFITAWGTGGELAIRPAGARDLSVKRPLRGGSVRMDTETNQMTIRVPRGLPGMDPGTETWRYVLGVGLWSGDGFTQVAAGQEPTADRPASGDRFSDAPAIFNLGFRFTESGQWFQDRQARSLADRTSGEFTADVDFAVLAAGASRWIHPPGATQARILASRWNVPEGIHDSSGSADRPGAQPVYGGRLQPYALRVPPPADERPGLTLTLHGAGQPYTQYTTYSPNFLTQMGDERNSLVVMPHGRTTRTAGQEYDHFEVWADVARHFNLDPDKVAVTGYSSGAWTTFKYAIKYPDLFGKAFPVVAPAWLGRQDDTNFNPMAANMRWVPWLGWDGIADEIALYPGILVTHRRFAELGLRHELWSFPAEHFTFAVADQWRAAAEWLGDARVVRDPARVDYSIVPSMWDPERDLLADHAYWLSDLRIRDEVPDTTGNGPLEPAVVTYAGEDKTARGYVTAVSRAFGEADPVAEPVAGAHAGPPMPATKTGTKWRTFPRVAPANALEITLKNIRQLTVDGARARLSGAETLTLKITSDGDARMTLSLPLPAGTTVTTADGEPAPNVTITRDGAVLSTTGGSSVYVITPPRGSGGG